MQKFTFFIFFEFIFFQRQKFLKRNKCLSYIYQNPTKGRVAFSGFSASFPPLLTGLSSKCHNFFLFGLCWVWKSMLDKSIHFVCFPKKIEFVCFPPFFTLLFQKIASFLPKIVYIGGKQTNYKKQFLNEKFECFRCFFIHWLY